MQPSNQVWRVKRKSQIVNEPGHGCVRRFFGYIVGVNRLTKQEQTVLLIVLGLLLTGWFVKFYRETHFTAPTQNEGRPSPPVQQAKP
jgi:hypothetical protein